MTAYRDDDQALQERMSALRDDVAALRGMLPRALASVLPAEQRELLLEPLPEGDETAIERLEQIVDAWRDAIARRPELETQARAVDWGWPSPEVVAPELDRKLIHASELPSPADRAFEEAGLVVDECLANKYGTRSLCRVTKDSVPIAILLEPKKITAALFVARGAPAFALSPEGYRHNLLKGLGLLEEVEVGESAFDGLFLFRADDPQLALQLLDGPSREALVAMAGRAVPTLYVEMGRLVLSWDYAIHEPLNWRDRPLLSVAVDLLLALRARSSQLVWSSDTWRY